MPRGTRELGVRHHVESHAGHRAAWLRAAVLGANDGVLSLSALLVGVAAAQTSRTVLLTTGLAAMVGGAGSMAVGEYSSVSSQRDAELADLAKEADELVTTPRAELAELATIYENRGLSKDLARQVAVELTEHDALAAHARDELGLDPESLARPVQAAAVSAASFTLGALLPLLLVLVVPQGLRVPVTVVVSLIELGALGALGAHLGGAPRLRPALRVLVGGAVAMAATWIIGRLVGTTIT